ncbi:MAG: MoaD/ThiS family protein [Acidimicrobiales bacterium]|nr:MoaD/ThiS family protein [Acidimicrobiales bacterium]|tara:strand:- start:194 stop:430 length:237 start_codon:yes stop_codon:yes gene_type:complete
MAILRLFASVKQMAGTGSVILSGATVADVVEEASQRYGAEFSDMARNCRIWLNGNPTEINTPVNDDDEIALLPPVSGG